MCTVYIRETLKQDYVTIANSSLEVDVVCVLGLEAGSVCREVDRQVVGNEQS